MATLNDWNAYLNTLHELARVEDALRAYASDFPPNTEAGAAVHEILWTEFGVTL